MSNSQTYTADKPINKETEDRFRRYKFSKRIADTIINRKDDESIVIGIYGAWGEGKTSVLNFIDTELKRKKEIITVKFNPWRYGDEVSLLKQFFSKLAAALNLELKSKTEKAGELIKKY